MLEIYSDPTDRARTLNNLAVLYSSTQRMKEAEQAYAEALATYRKLAEANPDAYLPYVAGTLNNLAVLYSGTQRMKEAEQAYAEALATYRKLAEANPDAYLPDVAMALNNLAILYRGTQRMKEAEQAYAEALATYRKLAEANPDAYLPDVAMALNNLRDSLSGHATHEGGRAGIRRGARHPPQARRGQPRRVSARTSPRRSTTSRISTATRNA